MSEFRWTGEQAEAIRARDHTLLAANAGTGKTTVVIGKILWRLGYQVGMDRDAGEPIAPPPESERCELAQVAAITFTEKAAHDLKRKLRDEILKHDRARIWDLDRASIGTIHGFCGDLLREHALRLGIDPGFRVLDERESRVELEAIVRDLVHRALQDEDEGTVDLVEAFTVEGWKYTPGAVGYVRDMMRDLRWHPERYAGIIGDGELDDQRLRELCAEWDDRDDPPVRYCAAVYRLAVQARDAWMAWLADENARDFDSLILDARDLLTGPDGAAALAGIRRRYRLLIIDEFQDTDGAQRDIAFAIAGLAADGSRAAAGGSGDREPVPAGRSSDGPQLFLVGDPKQSIYRFRGADISVWNEVQRALCGDERPLELTYNFRSDPRVVDFVNRVSGPAMGEVADELSAAAPDYAVAYTELAPARAPDGGAEIEWLDVSDSSVSGRRAREAEMAAARIRDIVVDPSRGDTEGIDIVDPDSPPDAPERRACRYRDVAILFRTRTGIEEYERALQEYGVPYYLAGDAGFTDRLEVLDCLNALRLVDNPRDDLRAFAYLRSPFVGLRDEVIARMRLEARGGSLLRQARAYLEGGEWFDAPEDERIVEIERRALSAGLSVIEEMAALRSRLPLDRLLEEILERTGYRTHLLLLDPPEPPLANIQRLLALLEGYRDHTVGAFLEIWDRWGKQDLGIPQAPLYSREDDVVTLSTIHSAKGLEWPVVFYVDNDSRFDFKLTNSYWSDREFGPIICPRKHDRGPRAQSLYARADLESKAEEARLLYVATTRARDRLVLAGPTEGGKGVCEWLARGLGDGVTVSTEPVQVERPPPLPEPELSWLDDVDESGAPPALVARLRAPGRPFVRSASELLARARSRAEWELKYVHGVTPPWYFARELPLAEGGAGSDREKAGAGDSRPIPARARGTLIHGVLERIREEEELSELLEEAIGALDSPELEERMARGSEYRRRLEQEIARVVASDEWKWYVEGEHHRELEFVHLVSSGKWRVGAIDLYRPRPDERWIIDFKTHDIGPDEVEAKAGEYRMQARVYAAAARATAGPARVRFHFTRPNRIVDG